MKYRLILLLFSTLLFGLFIGCGEEKDDALVPNILPETNLFLQFSNPQEDMPDTTVSRQNLFWHGNDADGRVVGFYYHWDFYGDENDPANWVWTVKENETFYIPLQAAWGIFTFQIKAVDNHALFDGEPAEDNPPFSADDAIDPTPALIRIPVRNSAPEMSFVLGSNPDDDVADTTFTTRSFFWTAEDLDGEETITHFEWALDDTTTWNQLPNTERSLTLEDIPEGLHTFFIRAVDIASATSQTLVYPDTTGGETGRWYVKVPRGPLLLVNDDPTLTELSFYTDVFNTLPGLMNNYSVWDVRENIPYFMGDTEATLKFFDAIIWNAYRAAQVPAVEPALESYLASGRKLFFSSSLCFDSSDTLFSFIPSDSMITWDLQRIFGNTQLTSAVGDYPSLKVGTSVVSLADAMTAGPGAETLFILPDGSYIPAIQQITGDLPFGIRYPAGGPGSMIYLPAPLHFFDGDGNGAEFLRIILQDDFGL